MNNIKAYRRRFIKISEAGLYRVTSMAKNFVFSALIIYLSDTHLWGALAAIIVSINLLIKLSDWGQQGYLVNSFAEQADKIYRTVSDSVFNRSIIIFILSVTLGFIYGDISIFLLSILYWINSTINTIILIEKDFRIGAILEVALISFVSLGLWIASDTLELYFLIQILTLGMLIKVIFFIRYYRLYFSYVLKSKLSYTYFTKSFFFFFIPFIGFLNSKIDLYAIQLLMINEALGKYFILVQFMGLYYMAVGVISTPFLPNIIRMNKTLFKKVYRINLIIALLICLMFILLVPVVLDVIYQISFPFLTYLLLLPILVCFPLYNLLSLQLFRHHKYALMIKATMVVLIFNTILTFVFVPNYGINGALLSTGIAQVLFLVISLYNFKTI